VSSKREQAQDGYVDLAGLVRYSSMSRRWLGDRIADPIHPLPIHQPGGPGGKILVRLSDYDEWLATYRRIGPLDLDVVTAVGKKRKALTRRDPIASRKLNP